jgi:hypothetical protein
MTVINQNLNQEEINRRLNSGNAYCHSVQNSCQKYMKNEISKTTTFPVICAGAELGVWH